MPGAALPYTELRVIGDERALFEHYLLHNGSLAGCAGRGDAAIAVAARWDDLNRALKSKWEHDHYGGLLEHVADQLATRRQDYAAGLSADALAAYDAPENRTNYLKMQAVLADLGLRVRSELGRAFHGVIEKRDHSGDEFSYGALHFDSKPEWVFVFCSCAGIPPAQLTERMRILMVAAMAFYRKTHCIIIIDRERAGYEVGLRIDPSPPSSPTERALGDRRFNHLRMTDGHLALIPG